MQHNYSKEMMIRLAVAFMVLPTIFVVRRNASALLALTAAAAVHGHLGQHQPLDANGQPIMDDPGLIFFEETKFAINMISIIGLGLVKSSLLIMYKNIFAVRKFQIVVYCVLAFVVGWTISFSISHLFTCYPITVFIEPYYNIPMFLSLLFTGVIADVAILVLPIPMVMSIKMEFKKKLAVILMLALGAAHHTVLPLTIQCMRSGVFFWTNIELSLAIVCACLPTLRPIWFHFHPREPTLKTSSAYGSSKLTGSKPNSSFGVKYSSSRKPYREIDELELTQYDNEQASSIETGPRPISDEPGIRKAVTIHQTLN
ncbi:hypothetical protein SNOG_05163 [Parastagonospora nodorum SN15]|uniref:Rhodopsin domain-containing protein n=1 Tax=Phaeosphaeria nodorum (strain SN15 / ATCC MYA-4574 / FGSC 10173) TaxID=321614 RepID=Q0USV1_PHANO|nr:hypothetical protein SNOG_05163 [Parastagonospora nodorum SN15]EAT87554.1 hypothetical protein SNOG_05163 [Parastagonospora nodorum SN15]